MKSGICALATALAIAMSSYAAGNVSAEQPAEKATAQADSSAAGDNATYYDSDYQAAARLRGADENTPEADARPGEYYFKIGARAFQKNDAKFAVEMYQVAASWAFKPAEYNLGVMYARGQGVAVDLPRALAWMALAAERKEPRYVAARDLVQSQLAPEQVEQARVIVDELKKTYGDEVALRRAKARWADVRAHMTGSRVGSVGHLDVGVPQGGSGDPSNPKGKKGVHRTGTSSAEVLGGDGVDGSIAYRQLLESDNPYDPKFERRIGTATVEPLIPVNPPPKGDAAAAKTPNPSKQN